MIDDEKEVVELLRDMEDQLPIPVLPTVQLSETLTQGGTELRPNQAVQIDSVLYMGDVGGIACALKWPGAGKSGVVTSLTHLCIDNSHPLAGRIKAYQSRRSLKIGHPNGGGKPIQSRFKGKRKRRGRLAKRRH